MQLNVAIAQNVSLNEHLALSTYLRNITKYISRTGDVDLHVLMQGPADGIRNELEGAQICEIESNTYSILDNLRYSMMQCKQLKKINDRVPIDLIHCIYPNSSLLGAVLFKKITGSKAKIIYDIRSPWIENSIPRLSFRRGICLYKKIAYMSEKALARQADGYIFITQGLKETYESLLNMQMEPSAIVSSGIDLRLFHRDNLPPIRNLYGIDNEHILIGYVGILSREREMAFALKAFREVIEHDSKYRLMFVGEGDDRKRLENLSSSLGLEDYVIFTGSVSHEEVPRYLNNFDLGLCHLPNNLNFRFSFPMKVLEYYSCGLDVLASNILAHQEISKSLPLILYNVDKVSDLSGKILNFRRNPKQRNNSELHSYSWEAIVEEMLGFYRVTIER